VADSSDVLMVLCRSAGSGIPAESQTVLDSSDTLLGPPRGWPTKFEAGKFFELESFSMNVQAEPSDTQEEQKTTQVVVTTGHKPSTTTPKKIGRGTKWNPGMLNPISCTRQVDTASPVLFQECGKATEFAYAAIVRRKVIGGGLQSRNQDTYLMSYLRIDFKDVVIVELGWNSQDDGVKETFQFVCSKASVLYRQQLHTGKVSTPLPPGDWEK
jgi:type VI protein secretion system component Hcp